jgi:membrane-associated phospholipid phosphatase
VSLQRLIPLERRGAALGTAGIAALVVAVLAVLVHGKRQTAVDHWIARWIYDHLRSPWTAHVLLNTSDSVLIVTVLGSLVVGALLRRAWNVAAFAVLGPTAAVLVSELVLKPLVHRPIGAAGLAVANAFPSGHETGVVAAVTVLAVLALRMKWRLGVEVAVVSVLGLWSLAAAVGLARNFLHFPSDTLGGAGVAVAVVLATAVAIDELTDRQRATADARAGLAQAHVGNHDRPA